MPIANTACCRSRRNPLSSSCRARSHVGDIQVIVDHSYKDRGLGATMLRELIAIAIDGSLEQVVFELVGEKETQAIEAAGRLGFIRIAELAKQVKDVTGRPHNLILLKLPLGKSSEWWRF